MQMTLEAMSRSILLCSMVQQKLRSDIHYLIALEVAVFGMNQTWGVNHSSELQTFWLLTVFCLRGAGGNETNKGKKKNTRCFC